MFFRELFLAPLVREISWGNNVVIIENAKMICNGQKNLERIAYTNYIISINTAYNNVNTVY